MGDLKQRIRRTQISAALAVNYELVTLYCQMGCEILQRQAQVGWRATWLGAAFPEMNVFPSRNLKYMYVFAPIQMSQLMSHLRSGWWHNCPGSTPASSSAT